MKILDELKYQVELKMHKHKERHLSSNDKVLFLTKVLYDRVSVREACNHLKLPLSVGQAILQEHYSLLKTKTKYKNQQRSRVPTSSASTHESAQTQCLQPRRAGFKAINKDFDRNKFSVSFAVNGQEVSHRTMKTQYFALIKVPSAATH